MYGLPEDTDLSFMVGWEVMQICVGTLQLQINFINTSLYIECKTVLEQSGVEVFHWPNEGVSRFALMDLLRLVIVSYEIIPGPTVRLKINFSKEYSLILEESSEPFESFQIAAPGTYILV